MNGVGMPARRADVLLTGPVSGTQLEQIRCRNLAHMWREILG